MRALLLVAGAAQALTARHLLNGTCASLSKRLDDSFLVPRLEKALQAAKPPAVQVFANAAHSILLENFLCGLPRQDLRDHVVVWAADAATNARMRSHLPAVRVVDVSKAFGDGSDAPATGFAASTSTPPAKRFFADCFAFTVFRILKRKQLKRQISSLYANINKNMESWGAAPPQTPLHFRGPSSSPLLKAAGHV